MDSISGIEVLAQLLEDTFSMPCHQGHSDEDFLSSEDLNNIHILLLSGCFAEEDEYNNFRDIALAQFTRVYDTSASFSSYYNPYSGFGDRGLDFTGNSSWMDAEPSGLVCYANQPSGPLRRPVRTARLGLPKIDLPSGLLDTKRNFNFTKTSDRGKTFYRGGRIYERPCGWIRYAFNVAGKYPPNDVWLEGTRKRSSPLESSPGEWPVSYHGTSYNNGLSIAQEGYNLACGQRFKHGFGIYSTPEIRVAVRYAKTVKLRNRTYQVMIQNRVNPLTLKTITKEQNGVGEYYVSPNSKDVRPYAFCIRAV